MMIALSIFSYLAIFALLGALAYRDIKEYILPDSLNAALAVSFIILHITKHWQLITPLQALEGCLAGGGLLLLIRAIANRFYHEDALGLGDVKLMAAAGLGLGFPNIFMALSLGSFIGLLHGVYMAILDKRKSKDHKINLGHVNVPAGLGLTIGIALMMAYQFGFESLIILKK
jgi:leader peptidase (prepilin peptidase)/N-methyltransferase